MHQKEALIRERRQIEAIRNDLMGPSGKLGTIVMYLGSQIRSDGGAYYECSELDDPWEIPEDKPEIADWDDELVGMHIGWIFDGLSRGMHIEIKYLEQSNELSVSYKGYLVYKEVSGQLECYAPFKDWEEMISTLFSQANALKKKHKKEEKMFQRIDAKQQAKSLLNQLKLRWGI